MLSHTQQKQIDFKIIFTSRDDGLSQELVLPGEYQNFLKTLELEDLSDVTKDGTLYLSFEDSDTRKKWVNVLENSE